MGVVGVAILFLDAGGLHYRMSIDWSLQTGGSPGEDLYLEVAAVVTTLVLAGRYFEARAKRRAGAALRALLELGAPEATLLVDGRGTARAHRTAGRGRYLRGAAG